MLFTVYTCYLCRQAMVVPTAHALYASVVLAFRVTPCYTENLLTSSALCGAQCHAICRQTARKGYQASVCHFQMTTSKADVNA